MSENAPVGVIRALQIIICHIRMVLAVLLLFCTNFSKDLPIITVYWIGLPQDIGKGTATVRGCPNEYPSIFFIHRRYESTAHSSDISGFPSGYLDRSPDTGHYGNKWSRRTGDSANGPVPGPEILLFLCLGYAPGFRSCSNDTWFDSADPVLLVSCREKQYTGNRNGPFL